MHLHFRLMGEGVAFKSAVPHGKVSFLLRAAHLASSPLSPSRSTMADLSSYDLTTEAEVPAAWLAQVSPLSQAPPCRGESAR